MEGSRMSPSSKWFCLLYLRDTSLTTAGGGTKDSVGGGSQNSTTLFWGDHKIPPSLFRGDHKILRMGNHKIHFLLYGISNFSHRWRRFFYISQSNFSRAFGAAQIYRYKVRLWSKSIHWYPNFVLITYLWFSCPLHYKRNLIMMTPWYIIEWGGITKSRSTLIGGIAKLSTYSIGGIAKFRG